MKVFVVGASGKIGQHLIHLLKESNDHSARAMVRKEEQAAYFKTLGVESAVVNLEGSVDEIAAGAKDCDAIVFTAGSGGHTGADKTLLIDLDGAAKTIEAAIKAGVKRFIIVSALQAHNREKWNEALRPYYVAKHYADKILEQSGLTYTIIRPGGLLDEPGTGKINVAENLERGSIPREDVARTVITALNEESTFNRAFDLVAGDTPVSEALKKG
ncbi:SDR family NAD(P)-dependent oxidoreductase [Pontibacter diazotrophicus]|uniref:SDR family NAD(P)-dependent oxidoreductase n=1 Tax=Pontibacter diazotrophicus TaxID=1400979 RepID=A0A3D8LAY0_9BACT|nr:SDR family oxidoreductase [Pontibacter diazotrophicus]RDV14548.1 SDR family NAD(P)-dependent oxidoreductase [Pontibacter diazotrophicus]